MFDYKLRFESEQQADAFLVAYEHDVHNVVVARIGTLYEYEDSGELDEEGLPKYNAIPLEGYHVDVRSRYEMDCGGYVVEPKNPKHQIA